MSVFVYNRLIRKRLPEIMRAVMIACRLSFEEVEEIRLMKAKN